MGLSQVHTSYGGRLREAGFATEDFDASLWQDAPALFIPIQAHEANANHREYLARFAQRYEPAVRARLEFGGTITADAYRGYKARQMEFCAASTQLFEKFDFLIAPVTPVRELRDGEDHSGFRSRILQITAPISLNGWPALTVRGRGTGPEDLAAHGFGLQIVAPAMADGKLFGLAAALAQAGMH